MAKSSRTSSTGPIRTEYAEKELAQPMLLSMAPQSGIPYEVLVMLIGDFDPDSLYNEGMNPQLSEDIQLYAVFNGAESLVLPLFEAGVYSIVCLDEDENHVGEGVSHCRKRQLRYEPEKTGLR